MTMIERLARAIDEVYRQREAKLCKAFGEDPPPRLDTDWQKHTDVARAVLGALEEPDEGMIEAGAEALATMDAVYGGDGSPPEWKDEASHCWQATIRKAKE